MTLFTPGVGGADSPFYPYEINQALMCNEFDGGTSLNFSFGHPNGGNQQLRYRHAFSSWVKVADTASRDRYLFGNRHGTNQVWRVGLNTSFQLLIHDYNSSYRTRLETTNLFRDVTNWFHMFYKYDSTQLVESDRVRLWINGDEITDFAVSTYPALNDPSLMFLASGLAQGDLGAGRYANGSQYSWKGNLAETHTIDGWDCTNFDLITVNDFGFEKNGVWVPKKYKYRGREGYGQYGGYYNYSNAGSLGQDFSGNGNNMTSTNITTDNQVDDSPTNNRCILHAGDAYSEADGRVIYGGLGWEYTSTVWLSIRGTFKMSSGKWYYETKAINDLNYSMLGWGWAGDRIRAINSYPGGSAFPYSCAIYCNSNNSVFTFYQNGSTFPSSISIQSGDNMLGAIDIDEDKVWFGVNKSNGTTYWFDSSGGTTGDPENNLNPTFSNVFGEYIPVAPQMSTYSQSLGNYYNFGQWPFLAQPKGFRSLCSKNLEDSKIYTPTLFHGANLRVGDGVDGKLIEFSSERANDLIITKNRSTTSNWRIADKVRGDNKNFLFSNVVEFEPETESSEGGIGIIRKRKYELVEGTTDLLAVNNSGNNYIDYLWGFEKRIGIDIVTWVGNGGVQQVQHKLRKEPKMIWVKVRDKAISWVVYHRWSYPPNPEYYYLTLNQEIARYRNTAGWNDTRPNSEYFTVGSTISELNYNYIAYVFTDIPGFSSFGYTQNTGSDDGAFMYTDFTPKWFMYKTSSTTGAWVIKDSYREKNNPFGLTIIPSRTDGELSNNSLMDFCSNGVKWRGTIGANVEGVWAAFAENPFKYSNAR